MKLLLPYVIEYLKRKLKKNSVKIKNKKIIKDRDKRR
jgi:hypothetical protein